MSGRLVHPVHDRKSQIILRKYFRVYDVHSNAVKFAKHGKQIVRHRSFVGSPADAPDLPGTVKRRCLVRRQDPRAFSCADSLLCEETLLPKGGQTVYILGLPWQGTFRIVDSLIQKGFRVIHYMLRKRILENPDLLRSLMLHMLTLPYQAMMLEEEPDGAWNLMATDDGQLFVNGNYAPLLLAFLQDERFACLRELPDFQTIQADVEQMAEGNNLE